MFGNKPAFGTGTVFGTGTTSTFGAAKPLGTSFGSPQLFNPTQPTGSIFGGGGGGTTSVFGTGAGTSSFGQTTTTPSAGFGFGGTSTGTSLFGAANQQQPTNTGLFSNVSGSAFGSPKSTFGGFGASTSGTTLFGQTQQPQQQQPGMLYPTGTSMFGTSAFGSNAVGTTIGSVNGTTVKFVPVNGSDTMMKNGVSTHISTRHLCITVMKEYENKSLEELRMEDYAANRKGVQGAALGFGTPSQTGLFTGGAITTAPSSSNLFGQANQNKSLFGATTAGFGSTTPGIGMFGQQNQQQSITPFGAKPLGFGTTPTTQSSSFGFGNTTTFGMAPQQKSLFGQAPTSTGTSLFGSTTTAAQPNTAFSTGVNFGSGFGTQNQAGVFGKTLGFGTTPSTTTAPAFSFGANAPTNAGAFSFNQNKPATTGFGTGFGAPATGFTGFGNTATNQTTGLFAQAKPQLSFDTGFGSSLNAPTGSFFGNTANKPSLLGMNSGFGMGIPTATTFGGGMGVGFGASNFNFGSAPMMSAFGNDHNYASQLSSQQGQQQLLALATSPYGDSPLFRNVLRDPSRTEEIFKPTNLQAQKALSGSSLYKVSPGLSMKVKLKPISSLNTRKSTLFDDLHENTDSETEALFVSRRNVKKLVISSKPKTLSNVSLTESGVTHDEDQASSSQPLSSSDPLFGTSISQLFSSPKTFVSSLDATTLHSKTRPSSSEELCSKNPSDSSSNRDRNEASSFDDTMAVLNTNRIQRDILSPDFELANVSNGGREFVDADGGEADGTREKQQPHPAGIILQRTGYFTMPSLDELAKMVDDDGCCFVESFTIGREGYGNVYFPGITNVAKLNLDEIVHFRRKEVIIYPTDDLKPSIGCGLNKKAQITLDCVWPNDKTTHTPIKSLDRLKCMHYQDMLENVTARLGARFIEYRPETGSWVFQVNHFSKYGLQDSDEEEIPAGVGETLRPAPLPQGLLSQQQNLNRLESTPNVDVNGMRAQGRPDNLQQKATSTPIPPHDSDEEKEMEGMTYPNVSPFEAISAISPTYKEHFLLPSQLMPQSIATNNSMFPTMKESFFSSKTMELDDNYGMSADPLDKLAAAEQFSSGRHVLINGAHLSSSIRDHQPDSPDLYRKPSFLSAHNESQVTPKLKYSKLTGAIGHSMIKAPAQQFSPVDTLSKFTLLGGRGLSPERLPISGEAVPTHDHLRMVSFERSTMYDRQHVIADFASFKGRSFRVGWGPNLSLAHCGTPLGHVPSSTSRGEKTNANLPFMVLVNPDSDTEASAHFSVTIESVSTAGVTEKPEENGPLMMMLNSLKAQLSMTRIEVEDGCPLAIPVMGVELLHRQAEIASSQVADSSSSHPEADSLLQYKAVWELMVALWGRLNEPSSEDDQIDEEGTYAKHMSRRDALTDWLQTAISSTIVTEVRNNKQIRIPCDGHLLSIFSHMTGLQVEEAVLAALDNQDVLLSVLLSQAGCSVKARDMLRHQLDHWEETRADQHIALERLKIYALLAGSVVWPASACLVNTCERLDWKRAFAVHLWYHCLPTATIGEAIAEYDNAHKGNSQFGSYAPPPLPIYVEKTLQRRASSSAKESELQVLDTCYYLLQLYNDRLYPLDQLLTPNSSVPDTLDHKLSWLLCQALRAIGYENLSQLQKCKLHCNFSSQLISMGLWQWAIFVLLHIENAFHRKSSVLDVLLRHVLVKSTDFEVERFLSEKLLIPKEWIYEAKAILARHNGDVHAEAYYLLKSGQWNLGHKLIVEHIAPDSIINECYDYLKSLLVRLVPVSRNSTISNWASSGQVFLDYIHLSQTVDMIVKGEVSAYELGGLQPEVTNLCSRIGSLKCTSAKDRLCVSEMAKKTTNLLRVVLSLGSSAPSRLMSAHIGKLPLPEDYGMQEYKQVMQSYCQEMR